MACRTEENQSEDPSETWCAAVVPPTRFVKGAGMPTIQRRIRRRGRSHPRLVSNEPHGRNNHPLRPEQRNDWIRHGASFLGTARPPKRP